MKYFFALTCDLFRLFRPYPYRFRGVRMASVMVLAAGTLHAGDVAWTNGGGTPGVGPISVTTPLNACCPPLSWSFRAGVSAFRA